MSEKQKLLDIIARFPRQTVLVVGDLVADEFVFGEIARVSREAPVLILKHRESRILPGGGANAVYNLADLGARVLPVGIVGDDAPGRALLRKFREKRIPTGAILVARDAAGGFFTTTKTRILAGTVHGNRQQVLRLDLEPSRILAAEHRRRIERLARRLARRAQAVLISDYGYGAATPALAKAISTVQAPFHSRSRSARRNSRLLTVDSRYDIARYRGATAATPNEPELEEIFHLRIGHDTRRLEQAGRALLRRMKMQALLVTRGRDGMALFERGRQTVHLPIFGSDQIADVTGAGDTVIAVFTLALAAGADFQQAARVANFAGGIVVMKRGTATVTAEELRQAVEGS